MYTYTCSLIFSDSPLSKLTTKGASGASKYTIYAHTPSQAHMQYKDMYTNAYRISGRALTLSDSPL